MSQPGAARQVQRPPVGASFIRRARGLAEDYDQAVWFSFVENFVSPRITQIQIHILCWLGVSSRWSSWVFASIASRLTIWPCSVAPPTRCLRCRNTGHRVRACKSRASKDGLTQPSLARVCRATRDQTTTAPRLDNTRHRPRSTVACGGPQPSRHLALGGSGGAMLGTVGARTTSVVDVGAAHTS